MNIRFNITDIFKIIACLGLGVFFPFGTVAEKIDSDQPNPGDSIPKIIHYVWLGSDELPQKAKESIASWQKYHPDFQIKRWDEKNCNINENPFVKEAYRAKRYDFASDWCRIRALEEGGIYMDTDMLLKARLDSILDAPLVLTLQRQRELSGSFMAVVPDHPFVSALKIEYENRTGFDDFELYNAPHTWSRTFEAFFRRPPTIEKRKEYRIVAPNILMYDFKGGENLAEHLYGAGSTNGQQSKWYHQFRENYLKQFAFYIPTETRYFIIQNDTKGYFYTPDQDKTSRPTNYQLTGQILKVRENNKIHSFSCTDQICK